MRKPLIAGNWKLHKTIPEAIQLANELKRALYDFDRGDILICPPFTSLSAVADVLEGSNIYLGAQDLFWEDSGAFTGEVSGPMLKDAGCSFVIVGHSERRQYFGDNDKAVNKKLRSALQAGLTPILCVGESLEKREQKVTKEFLRKQLGEDLKNMGKDMVIAMVIAYEPIWAIGTGRTASPDLAGETHHFIRQLFEEHYDSAVAGGMKILYGGSVKPDNAEALMAREDVDGFLIGGASLEADSFIEIARLSVL
jgi:triosephosphate isomerase